MWTIIGGVFAAISIYLFMVGVTRSFYFKECVYDGNNTCSRHDTHKVECDINAQAAGLIWFLYLPYRFVFQWAFKAGVSAVNAGFLKHLIRPRSSVG